MNRLLLALALAAASCSSALPEDAEDADAAHATPVAVGKADAPLPAGDYAATADSFTDGDLPFVALYVDDPQAPKNDGNAGDYVRLRCYYEGCAEPLPETDRYRFVRTASGKTYVQFMSFTVDADSGKPTPVVADTYQVKVVKGGIKLRRTYTTRWVTLAQASDASLCAASGGQWSQGACACPDDNDTGEHRVFAPGAGGCIDDVVGTEASCDASGGQYGDDDATRIGTFCQCGLGRFMTEMGCTDI